MASSLPLKGYLYTAWGDVHVKEAVESVAQLRKHDLTAHVTLVTNRPVYENPAGPGAAGTLRYHNVVKDAFDRVVVKDNIRRGFAGKVDCLSNEYYSSTFYLDTDTHVCADPSPLFDLLDSFDLCAVIDPAEVDIEMPGLTPYNTGVMLFGPHTDELFKKFKEYYNDEAKLAAVLKGHPAERCKTDQPSFMQAIKATDTKVHSLPNVWNARYRFSTSFVGPVKIIHGPPPQIGWDALEQMMNKHKAMNKNEKDTNRAWKAMRC
jgi:hypothetical protein